MGAGSARRDPRLAKPRLPLQERAVLVLDDISVRVAGRLLIDEASVRVPAGSRTGLVGRNGTGKTTLFNVITGEIGIGSGRLDLSARAPRSDGSRRKRRPVRTACSTSCWRPRPERPHFLPKPRPHAIRDRIAEIYMRLADIDAHSAPARAPRSFGPRFRRPPPRPAPCTEFSGGWRMRVALAADPVRRARSLAARRADQLSRSRRHALARRPSRALSAHRHRHQPRPRSARQCGGFDPASG